MLDPAVELLADEIDDYRLLCHHHIEIGIAVPPGEGVLDLLTTLTKAPTLVGALREGFDDAELVDAILAALLRYGFLHITQRIPPSFEELAELRCRADRARQEELRRPIHIDLDVPTSVDTLCERLNAEKRPPELVLQCQQLGAHRDTIEQLARRRQAGTVRIHQVELRTSNLTCYDSTRRAIFRLGASVRLEDVSWPSPDHTIPGLAELTRACVAVYVVMCPDASILDAAVRRRAADWTAAVFVSGLCLRLDADALWESADRPQEAFVDMFNAVRALEDLCGDVTVDGLPSDEVLLSRTAAAARAPEPSAQMSRFRSAYVRWRLPILKALETDNAWSQTPEAEEKLVPLQEDLFPNHPELLRIGPGSVVVDVCGGLGRVARRLAPIVGTAGAVISVEMLRCLSDRARQFTVERGIVNVHFRPGLAQRLPLPDGSVDAAVNEWTGAIWELGIGAAMLREMVRVVRPGGRIAVTHRLVQLPLETLAQPWVQYVDIYRWMRSAFAQPDLQVARERIWGQIVPSLVGERAADWRKRYMPRLIDPDNVVYESDEHSGPRADFYLSIIADRL